MIEAGELEFDFNRLKAEFVQRSFPTTHLKNALKVLELYSILGRSNDHFFFTFKYLIERMAQEEDINEVILELAGDLSIPV